MELCRSCSWSMKQAPKVFCPSCGVVWREAKPSKAPAKSKLGDAAKKTAAKKTTTTTKKKTTTKKGKK